MKNLYISAIIIIGLLMNMLPSAASALELADTDFEFEMTFDEEEFNNSDIEVPAVTTAIVTSTAAPETTVTTADTEVPPAPSQSPVTTSSSEDIVPIPTQTSTEIKDPSDSNQDTTIPKNTTTAPKPSSQTQKLMVFCSLSLKSESNNLLMTAKTQAKQTMDSIGFINVNLCKFDKDKKLISKTPVDDMLKSNSFICADENRIQIEGGYYYQVTGWHSVSLSGKSKTIYNESEMVFAESTAPVTTAASVNNNSIDASHSNVTETTPAATTAKIISTTVPAAEISQPCTTAAPQSTTNLSCQTNGGSSSNFKNPKPNSSAKPIKNFVSSSYTNKTSAQAKSAPTTTASHSQSRKTTSVSAKSAEIPPDTGDSGIDNALFIFILSSAAVLMLRKHEAK